MDDPALYKEYIHSLINYFKNSGITSILITEVDELLGLNTITFHDGAVNQHPKGLSWNRSPGGKPVLQL